MIVLSAPSSRSKGTTVTTRPWSDAARNFEEEKATFVEASSRLRLVIDQLRPNVVRALEDGLIRRFGVVVRHHELGIKANAMCVWDVPDELASTLGRQLARYPGVTLCYRRARSLPHWPYNLFCMIHGRSHDAVTATRNDIAQRLGLDRWTHAVLFSSRRFKQRGARYLSEGDA